ncbi:MAG TPA: hypothetical protein VHQ47_09195 [Phycisphaerae bacterium]|nr:hypothetical protein [Phycisphaerae bacterium]
MKGQCTACRQTADVTEVLYKRVTGMLLLVQRQIERGRLCAPCARRRHRLSLLHNATLGWWSRTGMIVTPIFIVQNFRQAIRASHALSAGNAGAVRRTAATPPPNLPPPTDPDAAFDQQAALTLPWGNFLGDKPRAQGIGQRQLSLALAIGALAALGGFVSLLGTVVLAFSDGANTPAQAAAIRAWSHAGLLLCALTLTACIFWEKRRTGRKDLALDVLGETIPATAIFEAGPLHVAVFATVVRGKIRIAIAAQNRFDQPARLQLSITDTSGSLPFETTQDGAEAAVYFTRTHCAVDNIGIARLRIAVTARGQGGPQVRFAARNTLRSADRDAILAIASIATGHIHIPLGANHNQGYPIAFMTSDGVLAVQANADVQGQLAGKWRKLSLWSPQHSMPPGFAASVFHKLLEDQTQTQEA